MGTNPNEEYFNYLLNRIGIENCPLYMVSKTLYETNFTPIMKEDANREHDGLLLRDEFALEYMGNMHNPINYIPPQCNMLEMLIALAERWDRQYMYDPRFGIRSRQWFIEMLTNLDIAKYMDNVWIDGSTYAVQMAIDAFLCRQYDYDGTGGLFPLKNPKRDQRLIQIWDQLSDYVVERYFPAFAV